MKKHRGMGMLGMFLILALVLGSAVVGMKMLPSYLEYFAIKKAFKTISTDMGSASVKDIKMKFTSHAIIDNIKSIKQDDLEITKEGGKVVVSASYQVTIPLGGNISLLLDFNPTTAQE